jgi:hypothetical protein
MGFRFRVAIFLLIGGEIASGEKHRPRNDTFPELF